MYKIEFSELANKQLEKFDPSIKKEILLFINKRIATLQNPRAAGEALKANLKDNWRYRYRDYRIMCKIIDDILLILVVEIGHRREIYKNK